MLWIAIHVLSISSPDFLCAISAPVLPASSRTLSILTSCSFFLRHPHSILSHCPLLEIPYSTLSLATLLYPIATNFFSYPSLLPLQVKFKCTSLATLFSIHSSYALLQLPYSLPSPATFFFSYASLHVSTCSLL
jgi:hypothetical protein